MKLDLTDDLIEDSDVGNVGQLTEDEGDSDIPCVFLRFDCDTVADEDINSLFLTRSDLLKLLAKLEEANER